MMQTILLALLISVSLLPEKQKPVQYRSVPIYKGPDTISFRTGKMDILFTARKPEGMDILLKKDGKERQRFTDLSLTPQDCPDTAYIADINGDQQPDIKFLFNSQGASPLAAIVKRKVYLISAPDGQYTKLSFFDFSSEAEMDFNGDKSYEIITRDLIQRKNHSYWKYEVYSFANKKLTNVSLRYGYPKQIPYRIKPTSKPVAISDAERRSLLSKAPREYEQQ